MLNEPSIDFEYAVVDAKESLLDAEKTYIEDAWPSLDPSWRLSR